MPKKIPVISLFSGSGGLDWGFRQAGFEPLLAVDVDQAAVDTYNANQPPVAQRVNLLTTTISDFVEKCATDTDRSPRGVLGGPPCQAFSVGNVHPVDQDPRARLVHRYTSLIKGLHDEFDLDFFVFENVKTLTSERYNTRYVRFKNALERAGFWLFEGILDAQDFGVAQRRPRLFVVGLNKDRFSKDAFTFPEGDAENRLTVRDTIGRLQEPVFFDHGLDPSTFPVHPNHWAMTPRSRKFTDGSLSRKHSGRSFRVLAWDKTRYPEIS